MLVHIEVTRILYYCFLSLDSFHFCETWFYYTSAVRGQHKCDFSILGRIQNMQNVTWLIHMCDMTHSQVRHDSFMCMTWLVCMTRFYPEYVQCNIAHTYVWHDSFPCVTWLIPMCDMTHSHAWHNSSICVLTRCAESSGEVGGWGRVPFSRNLMSPTPRRKWYLTTGRRFH